MTSIVYDTASTDRNVKRDAAGKVVGVPDMAATKASGVELLFVRKAFRTTPGGRIAADPDYAPLTEAARAAGIVVGGYLLPDQSPTALSAKEQVHAAKAAPGDVVAGKDVAFCLDIETNIGFRKVQPDATARLVFLQQLIREVQDQLGCTPGIYTSYFQSDDFGLGTPAWIAECWCWIKTAYRLGAGQAMDTVWPMQPHVGQDQEHDPRCYHRIPDAWSQTGWQVEQTQGDARGLPGGFYQADVGRFNRLARGAQGPSVKWAQRRLKVLGAPLQGPLNADGVFGGQTEGSVRAFQRGAGLLETGVVDAATFAALSWQP